MAGERTGYNINWPVRVKLTEHGRGVLERRREAFAAALRLPPSPMPKEDAEGWSEWQLWDLMNTLGRECIMGCPTPFETTIDLLGDPFARPAPSSTET